MVEWGAGSQARAMHTTPQHGHDLTPQHVARAGADNPGARAALRPLLSELNTWAGTLAALTTALNARASGVPIEPGVAAAVAEIIDALGVGALIENLSHTELRAVLGELRTFAATDASLVNGSSRPGWTSTDAVLLQAAGDVSSELPRAIQQNLLPRLTGLGERLATRGARFLDIGAGVAALSIQMALTWPELGVVAVEPWAPAVELARQNRRAAGLESRIELREQPAEQLGDEHVFDLAWVASLFIPETAFVEILRRVKRALHPGAWLLLPVLKDRETLALSVARLRTAVWGGTALGMRALQTLLGELGFAEVQTVSSSPASSTALLAARRR
jgi:precorrin-6B methylase 2